MAKMSLQYDVLNYTPASASPVESNFNRIEQHINQEVVERGGTVSMTAQLKLVGNPIAPLDAAPKQYVDQMLPIAIIMMYAGSGAPPGGRWALCNGAELEVVTYPALYDVLGNKFSPSGTPAGRFRLPDLQNRVAVGSGSGNPVGTTGAGGSVGIAPHSHALSTITTGPPSSNHTHAGASHSHTLPYGKTLDANVRHQHNYLGTGVMMAMAPGGGDVQLAIAEPGAPSIGVNVLGEGAEPRATLVSGPDFPTHAHDFGGSTNFGGNAATGIESSPHTHTLSGNTQTAGGTGGGDGSGLPPYVAVPYIIRIL